MKNREIKFRVFDGTDCMSTPFTMKDIQEGKIQFTSECPVMQYTGLKDKNGKEIYEGDLIKYISRNPFSLGEERTVKVWYSRAQFWCNGSGVGIYLDELLANEKCEIIGNIYEKPELLK